MLDIILSTKYTKPGKEECAKPSGVSFAGTAVPFRRLSPGLPVSNELLHAHLLLGCPTVAIVFLLPYRVQM